ncbi:hypothetical protein [Niallia sp. NCCP-28]|uniref:hypothetical protein n=1 Tax=Niallia sp. NCCP-28 TaxID=2934712 RepID=UPI002081585F|nr:hypothetical protein [Niallia sp. NCCP-28]GKU83230.1 hypothetical protein NCCP28_26260 [Niallia sp. NCCP-28]
MKNLFILSAVQYCMIWTFFSTFICYILTGFTVYTLAALLAGITLSFLNLLEDEVIHRKIRGD